MTQAIQLAADEATTASAFLAREYLETIVAGIDDHPTSFLRATRQYPPALEPVIKAGGIACESSSAI